VNPGFCEKLEVIRVPLGRPSRTTSGTRTTGWEPLLYESPENSFFLCFEGKTTATSVLQ